MRAALYQSKDTPLLIDRVDDPAPLPDQVVLKVSRAGICGSDLHLKQYGFAAPGTVFGHEFAGEIVGMGSAVSGGWKAGDRVTALPLLPCRHCEACDADLPGLCQSAAFIGTSLDKPGAYAEFVAVRGDLVQALPAGVSFDEGALVEPLAVAHHAVDMAGLSGGESVLIIGAGPIGAGAALFARMKGAGHVVVSERSADRRQLALELGATHVIDAANEDVAARFQAIAGRRPQVVFECVGVPGLVSQAVDLAAIRGQVIVAGVCFGEDKFLPIKALMKEVTIRFSQAYTERDFAAVIDAIAGNHVQARPMHSRSVGFAALPAAFDGLSADPRDCKILLDPGLD